jgi:hypothetical protein
LVERAQPPEKRSRPLSFSCFLIFARLGCFCNAKRVRNSNSKFDSTRKVRRPSRAHYKRKCHSFAGL